LVGNPSGTPFSGTSIASEERKMKAIARDWARRIPFVQEGIINFRALKNERKRIGNIAMFHSARCGSTVLGHLLEQHPAITWASELFNDIPRRHARLMHRRDRVEMILKHSMYFKGSEYYGFETKFLPEQHLRDEIIGMSLEDYIPLLKQMGFSYFIVLERKNYLRRLLSATVARQTDQWHKASRSNHANAVTLDLEAVEVGNRKRSLLEHFQSMDENYERLRSLLRSDPVLSLVYEDDILEDPGVAYGKVCRFLGVEELKPEVKLRRTNPFPIQDMVQNWDDLKACLRGTRFEWMLDQ